MTKTLFIIKSEQFLGNYPTYHSIIFNMNLDECHNKSITLLILFQIGR
jgi:hypothetical protein